jgi:hypothetical protein
MLNGGVILGDVMKMLKKETIYLEDILEILLSLKMGLKETMRISSRCIRSSIREWNLRHSKTYQECKSLIVTLGPHDINAEVSCSVATKANFFVDDSEEEAGSLNRRKRTDEQ